MLNISDTLLRPCTHCTGFPHSGQNFAPAVKVAPQAHLEGVIGVPHSGQNFAPAGTSDEHFGHFLAVSILAPHSGQNLVFSGITDLHAAQVVVG